MLHINFSRNVMGLLVLLLLSGLLMAQNAPEFGQIWKASSEEPTTFIMEQPGEWNEVMLGFWYNFGRVMWDGENYRYYVCARGPQPEEIYTIGIYTSPHLDSAWVPYENNPVFRTDSLNWDNHDVATPTVMKDGDIYKMWYCGRDSMMKWHVGYATSNDGYTWNRHPEPVLTYDPDSDWEADQLCAPFVLKEEDGTFSMWYQGHSGSSSAIQIGYASSPDGINWTRHVNNPVLEIDDVLHSRWIGYPTVKRFEDQYVMWYSGSHNITPYKVFTAISPDGVSWRKDYLFSPVINTGPAGSWSEDGITCKGVFVEDGKYKIIHSGADEGLQRYALRAVYYDPTVIASGNVSGTWTKAGSPYRVEGEITVPDGETLTVEAGTTVEFLNPSPLNVLGRILALGTDDERIRFRVDDTLGIYDDAAMEGVWGGIKFANTPTTNDSSRLSYCDIEFGDSWAGGSNNGGGIKIYNFGKLTVDNCLIQYNRAVRGVAGNYAYGGGICINYNSHPKILNNVIQHNHTNHLLEISGDTGGGIMVYDGSNPLISGNIIRWNRATETGGGLGIWTDSEPMIINNLIVENTALREDGTGAAGGGVATGWDSRPVLINNTIAENVAGWTGGGFYSNDGDAIFINTIIADNEDLDNPDIFGSQIGTWGMAGNTLHIYHSNLEHGVDSINWDGNQVGILDTEALVAQDPSLNSSYHLSFASRPMCGGIDSCEIDGEMYYAPDTDLNGNPRPSPAGTMPDKGCYEELLVDIDDIGSVPTGFQLYQNFPNPFNPLTSIRYTLPRPAEVNLVVYDILGQEVATLQSGYQTAGSYQTQWNGINASGLVVSTGMYFCRLQLVDPATGGAGSYSQTIKMVLLR